MGTCWKAIVRIDFWTCRSLNEIKIKRNHWQAERRKDEKIFKDTYWFFPLQRTVVVFDSLLPTTLKISSRCTNYFFTFLLKIIIIDLSKVFLVILYDSRTERKPAIQLCDVSTKGLPWSENVHAFIICVKLFFQKH